MNRRLFLNRIFTLMGVGAAAPVAHGASSRRLELQHSPVAGFQYHQGESVWPMLRVGAALALVREPDNPYDPRAVRVDWQRTTLGYVPRADNAAVSHLLDSGHSVEAEVVALSDADNPWERVEFALYLRD